MLFNKVGLIDDYEDNRKDFCPFDYANLNVKNIVEFNGNIIEQTIQETKKELKKEIKK